MATRARLARPTTTTYLERIESAASVEDYAAILAELLNLLPSGDTHWTHLADMCDDGIYELREAAAQDLIQ